MEKSGLMNELKANDETILTVKVYNEDEYLKKEGTRISVLEISIKNLKESLRSQKALLAKLKPIYEKSALFS